MDKLSIGIVVFTVIIVVCVVLIIVLFNKKDSDSGTGTGTGTGTGCGNMCIMNDSDVPVEIMKAINDGDGSKVSLSNMYRKQPDGISNGVCDINSDDVDKVIDNINSFTDTEKKAGLVKSCYYKDGKWSYIVNPTNTYINPNIDKIYNKSVNFVHNWKPLDENNKLEVDGFATDDGLEKCKKYCDANKLCMGFNFYRDKADDKSICDFKSLKLSPEIKSCEGNDTGVCGYPNEGSSIGTNFNAYLVQ